MKTKNYNITGTTVTKILSASDKVISADPSMTISNIQASVANVSVYYSKENYIVEGNTTETYYVLKAFPMSGYRTLTLDKSDFAFSNKGFDLYLVLSASGEKVDAIVNY
jgi:hypothetical protein